MSNKHLRIPKSGAAEMGELVSPWSMSIAGLSKMILETQVRCPFLLISVTGCLVHDVLLGKIYTSFRIEESVISMLPSSLVMHRLVLCLLASGNSRGL